MECNDIVERQKLVEPNDEEDENTITNVSTQKSIQASPISPVLSNKIFSSNSCSVKGDSSTKISYVNEKKTSLDSATKTHKSSAKKIPRELDPNSTTNSIKEQSSSNSNNNTFAARPLKHHSFISEVPDVRHMEIALLELLKDFHSGKLRAFGSGATMEQMTNIREQQESLAKLHFDLGATNDSFEMQSTENMTKLVQKLETLTNSLEQLTIN